MSDSKEISITVSVTIQDDRFNWRDSTKYKGYYGIDIKIPSNMIHKFSVKQSAKFAMQAAMNEYLASLIVVPDKDEAEGES